MSGKVHWNYLNLNYLYKYTTHEYEYTYIVSKWKYF